MLLNVDAGAIGIGVYFGGVQIWECEAAGRVAPISTAKTRAGEGAGGVAPPAVGVRGYTPGKFLKFCM
jgi:hypothetical protein